MEEGDLDVRFRDILVVDGADIVARERLRHLLDFKK